MNRRRILSVVTPKKLRKEGKMEGSPLVSQCSSDCKKTQTETVRQVGIILGGHIK